MGILGNYRESVTIYNRTEGAEEFERNLNVRYDGEDIILKPGANHNFPKVVVPYALKQNPLMGSKHPRNPTKFISLVGVEGSRNYPTTPLPKAVLAKAAGALEVVDRDGDFYGEPMEKVKLLKKSGYTPYEAQYAVAADFDVNPNIE